MKTGHEKSVFRVANGIGSLCFRRNKRFGRNVTDAIRRVVL